MEVPLPTTTIPDGVSAPDLRAHLAVPPVGPGPWPGVVVVHDAYGLTDDARAQADRLATAGYVAVAPDLYTAGGALRCMRSVFASLSKREGPAFGDLEAARRYLAGRSDGTGRVGVLGFCMGGGFALLAAPRGFNASAPNYGFLPKNPHEVLRGACPVVASYGGRDRLLRGAAAELEAVLADLDVEHDVHEYPEAGHSFLNRHTHPAAAVIARVTGFRYHEPSAEDAWARILRFFDRHLRAPG